MSNLLQRRSEGFECAGASFKHLIFITKWDIGGLMVGFSTALRGQTVGRSMNKS